MDIPETPDSNTPRPEPQPPKPLPIPKTPTPVKLDLEEFKKFFSLTGASILYCLSAVLMAYGIVNVMRPILAASYNLRDALPCVFTLHLYELALLGVLILIVSRKVVDDAISIAILMALFLVGTSMALGTVADQNLTASFFLGLVGVAVALGKFYLMRRCARIPFAVLAILGLGALVACNYLGPVLLARSIAIDPTQELARRGLWLFLLLAMLIAAALVLVEAARANHSHQTQQNKNERSPFLQTRVMVYLFALILLLGSGIHQYSMAFIFALERVLGDFVPLIAVAALLLLEILRHYGKRFGFTEIIISCAPLAAMLLAINEKSVLASGRFGIALICYPPVLLAITGLALAALAVYHRWLWLLLVVFAYGLGVILTVGFSPQYPYELNIRACVGTLVVALLVYGIIIRNPSVCLAAVIVLCLTLSQWDAYLAFAKRHDVTQVGALAGAAGLGVLALYLLFARRLHKAVAIVGSLCLAGFTFDYLPEHAHWRYLAALLATGLLVTALWFRTRDTWVISILWIPFFVRLHTLAKRIAHWRSVILAFLLLVAGAFVSLRKRPTKDRPSPPRPENPGESSP
jgi:hypothetical protein